MSLARCLFEELWLPVTCPGWNFEDAPAPEANLRIINMAPMPALLEAMQESLRWKLLPAQVKEQTNLWTEMCYRALEDGRFIICRWPAKDPDTLDSQPKYWRAWLLEPKGFSVHVTFASFTRHTKDIEDSIASGRYSRIVSAERSAWQQWLKSNKHQDQVFCENEALLTREYRDVPWANRLAWCLLQLKEHVKSHEGQEGLSKYASGVRGSVMHGAPSCLMSWVLKTICPCKPNDAPAHEMGREP